MQCCVSTASRSCGRKLISWHCSTIIFIYGPRGWRKQSFSFPLSVHCCITIIVEQLRYYGRRKKKKSMNTARDFWMRSEASLGWRRVNVWSSLALWNAKISKRKKTGPSCPPHQPQLMQTSPHPTPTAKPKKNTVCLGARVSIIFFKFLDSHGSDSSSLFSLIKYDPVGEACCKIHHNYLLPPMRETNSGHVANLSFSWLINCWGNSGESLSYHSGKMEFKQCTELW